VARWETGGSVRGCLAVCTDRGYDKWGVVRVASRFLRAKRSLEETFRGSEMFTVEGTGSVG
jgi:hypothetical protein